MSINEPDQTLEIIMTKLDPEVMKIFSKEVSSSAEDAAKVIKTLNLSYIKSFKVKFRFQKIYRDPK